MSKVINWIKNTLPGIAIPIVFLLGVLIAWELIVPLAGIPIFILPTPSIIFAEFIENLNFLVIQSSITIQEILIGFVLGAILGLISGTAIAYSKFLERVILPITVMTRVVPTVAIAPLLVIWFGYGIWSKVVAITITTFFPVLVNTSMGLMSVDRSLIDLMHSVSASELKIFRKVRLPSSLPFIFAALKVTITVATIMAVIAEFVAPKEGLGYIMLLGLTFLNVPLMFATILMLAIIGISLYGIILLIERLAIPWAISQRRQAQ